MEQVQEVGHAVSLLSAMAIVGIGCGVFGYLLADQIDTVRERMEREREKYEEDAHDGRQ